MESVLHEECNFGADAVSGINNVFADTTDLVSVPGDQHRVHSRVGALQASDLTFECIILKLHGSQIPSAPCLWREASKKCADR